jgi:hypothetical protein
VNQPRFVTPREPDLCCVADPEDKMAPERLLVPDLEALERRKRYPNAWLVLRKNLPETEDGERRDTDR